jgi:hypothetical protein
MIINLLPDLRHPKIKANFLTPLNKEFLDTDKNTTFSVENKDED